MSEIVERFRDHFAPWSITIPPEHVKNFYNSYAWMLDKLDQVPTP